jgi:hypothetical protein
VESAAFPPGTELQREEQTYTVDGADPDDAIATSGGITVARYAQLPVDGGFNQGLASAHLEAPGAFQQLLSGAKPINSFAIFEAEAFYQDLDKLFP